MGLFFRPEDGGGRRMGGESDFGSYLVVIDRSYDGEIYDAEGKRIGTATLEIREPVVKGSEKLNPRKPGDLMAVVARDVFGFGFDANCSCKKIQREMNAHGWGWCIRNRKDLMKRISDSAIKRNPPIAIDPDSIWQALKDAWKQRGGVAKE